MRKTDLLNIAALSFAAILCISGQSPRKEMQEVPTTQCEAREAEAKKEISMKAGDVKKRKSAARKSMEENPQTSMNQKSAAKRSMQS